MLNFRVDDLDALLDQLAAAGVRIDPKREDYVVRAICLDLGSGGKPRGVVAAVRILKAPKELFQTHVLYQGTDKIVIENM